MSKESILEEFKLFSRKKFDTDRIKERGPALPLKEIPKDDRYLISEMACKSFGGQPETSGEMQAALVVGL